MSLTYKVRDWSPEEYATVVCPLEPDLRELEAIVMDKVKEHPPEGCFMISVKVNVEYHVSPTREQIAKGSGSWTRAYMWTSVLVDSKGNLKQVDDPLPPEFDK